MVSGGAPLNPDVGIFFHSLGLTVLQGYGQTEAAPVISCNRPKAGIKMDTVGPPLKNTEVRIAEDGEILVRGELVMKGYWRNPAQTERALQDGWLHTGDVGHIDEPGPDRHHRPQEGSHRPRQGRQRRAAEGGGNADPPVGDPAGDGGRRPPPLSGRPDRSRSGMDGGVGEGERQAARSVGASGRSGLSPGAVGARSTGSMPIFR